MMGVVILWCARCRGRGGGACVGGETGAWGEGPGEQEGCARGAEAPRAGGSRSTGGESFPSVTHLAFRRGLQVGMSKAEIRALRAQVQARGTGPTMMNLKRQVQERKLAGGAKGATGGATVGDSAAAASAWAPSGSWQRARAGSSSASSGVGSVPGSPVFSSVPSSPHGPRGSAGGASAQDLRDLLMKEEMMGSSI